jgi:hypothetical protein
MSSRLSRGYKDLELSNATLRTEDLLQAFTSFLDIIKSECHIENEVDSIKEEIEVLEDMDSDTAVFILNEDLFNLLNEIAPEGCYFGSHEGDGSCFGFWFCEQELEVIDGGLAGEETG